MNFYRFVRQYIITFYIKVYTYGLSIGFRQKEKGTDGRKSQKTKLYNLKYLFMNKVKETYLTPTLLVVEVKTRGIVCTSPYDTEDYIIGNLDEN